MGTSLGKSLNRRLTGDDCDAACHEHRATQTLAFIGIVVAVVGTIVSIVAVILSSLDIKQMKLSMKEMHAVLAAVHRKVR